VAINIYEAKTFNYIVIISDDDWDLPTQIDVIEKWLNNQDKNYQKVIMFQI